jgi:hypothetical protein
MLLDSETSESDIRYALEACMCPFVFGAFIYRLRVRHSVCFGGMYVPVCVWCIHLQAEAGHFMYTPPPLGHYTFV